MPGFLDAVSQRLPELTVSEDDDNKSDAASMTSSTSAPTASNDGIVEKGDLFAADPWTKWLTDLGTILNAVNDGSSKALQTLQHVLVESEDVDRVRFEVHVGQTDSPAGLNVAYKIYVGEKKYNELWITGPSSDKLDRPKWIEDRLSDIVIGKRRFRLWYDREIVNLDGDKASVVGHRLMLLRLQDDSHDE